MHDVAWRGMWICVRSEDAQKQLARTSLSSQAPGGRKGLQSMSSVSINRVAPGLFVKVTSLDVYN